MDVRSSLIFLFILFYSFTTQAQRCEVDEVEITEKMMVDLRIGLLSHQFSTNKTQLSELKRTQSIPVYFHVINTKISQKQIDDQMKVLNKAYFLTGFKFELINVNDVNEPSWSRVSIGGKAERDMKAALRQGDSETLNIYIHSQIGSALGWAAFPWDYKSNPSWDGVVVASDSLPGSRFGPYNEGQTLTHEVGHWMGLFHTFQGGCSAQGDMIDDTPAQRAPSYGCDLNRDSCPNDPGKDPASNYMDYSDDACMTEFTKKQIERMDASFSSYRS